MLEKFLHQAPFVRFVIPLLAGILLKIYFPGFEAPFLFVIAALCSFLLLFEIARLSARKHLNYLFGFVFSLVLFFTGILLVQSKYDNKIKISEENHTYTAVIIENPQIKENSVKAIIEITGIKEDSSFKNTKTKVLAYFQKDSSIVNLKIGDLFIGRSQINEIKHSGNPEVFNYARYMFFKETYYQTYLKADQYSVIDKNKGNRILIYANAVRQKLLDQYKKHHISGENYAVLSALTLGYTNDMSPEIKQSFSVSGAMHVLSVSGLHVGIIFYIISQLLFFLEKKKYGRIFRFIIVLAVLFGYATLTGLSSSVMRSTLMFSLMGFGDLFLRTKNTYNTIAASAFIMLLINPFNIMDVGFQLSYLAVVSIVFFQPRIYSLFQFSRFLPDKTWQLISVSIAAQIGTLPITLFYFHQFPVYFIITNIFVIPLSNFIIGFAVILLIFSFSGLIGDFIAYLLDLQLDLFNGSVKWIESLPFSAIRSVFITNLEAVILFGIILIASIYLIKRKLYMLKLAFYMSIVFVVFNTIRIYNIRHESGLIVYNIPKTSAIEYYSGINNKLFINKSADEVEKLIKFNFQIFWDKQGIQNPVIVNSKETSENKPWNSYFFNNKRIIQINTDKLKKFAVESPIIVDYLILSENINMSISDLQKYFTCKQVIFDSSNQLFRVNQWKKDCELLGQAYHSVSHQGAFVIKQTF
ncbi:MAG: ComEC/Rec2 family competence protein [Bacteroidales bacterium]|nr:ComEC/Rec2 family competence protein [Bacteroidales bacterium]